jgi:hypothetical protein
MALPHRSGIRLDAEFFEFVASEFTRLVSEQQWNIPPLAQSLLAASDAWRRIH